MKRTPELFEKIEGYLFGTLSKEELLTFEKEMAIDSELIHEVEKQRELHRVLSDTDTLNFKEKLQKISAEVKQEQSVNNSTTTQFSYWKIAATIIVLLGIGTLLWNNFNTADGFLDLYASYYEPYPAEDITRGDALSELDMIMKNYGQGNYDNVISELTKDASLSISDQLRLYLGNSYLSIGKEQEALLQFEAIGNISKYYEEANWFRALTYLKKGEVKKSTEILEKLVLYNGIYKEKAIELIEKYKEL